MLLLVLLIGTAIREQILTRIHRVRDTINMSSGECEVGFADTCFTSVEEDLKYMLNVVQNLARNVSEQAVGELCLSIDDALNCTSDIIDTDCTFGEGKGIFDSWLRALRAVYLYICGSKPENLKDILESIQCWNIDRFFMCTKARAGLGHVRDLLHVILDDEECMALRKNFGDCYEAAQVSSCREQENIEDEFKEMTNIFFWSSYCQLPLPSTSTIPTIQALLWTMPFFVTLSI